MGTLQEILTEHVRAFHPVAFVEYQSWQRDLRELNTLYQLSDERE
jgi:hypothetical protein